ncbi:hypothetical protein, partial [Mesorhizobium sp. M1406]|uniref:hypothetical protein n=1 Tax=Mesorhizobium sp. M1406 TaxID=2957099 RepID=UPI00333BFE60
RSGGPVLVYICLVEVLFARKPLTSPALDTAHNSPAPAGAGAGLFLCKAWLKTNAYRPVRTVDRQTGGSA